jgi:hypothetical protein
MTYRSHWGGQLKIGNRKSQIRYVYINQ